MTDKTGKYADDVFRNRDDAQSARLKGALKDLKGMEEPLKEAIAMKKAARTVLKETHEKMDVHEMIAVKETSAKLRTRDTEEGGY